MTTVTQNLKGILSHIHKLYLKERYFCPEHNYTLKDLKTFFHFGEKSKKLIQHSQYVIGFKLQHSYGVITLNQAGQVKRSQSSIKS